MIRRFWNPTVTSQFAVCTVPFHLDTYRGCPYNCAYCFARDFTTFARRNSENKSFTYLEGNNPVSFARWVDRVLAKEMDYNKAHEVAFKERMPLKIGACSDPFPYVEKKERITYEFLKKLHEIDYPVQMSTKNPEVLLDYSHEFVNPNWVPSVTIVTINEEFQKVIEPSAISPARRLAGVEKLAKEGKNVLVRIQPTIYPNILDELEEMVRRIAGAGAKGFVMEGLKQRITMPKAEQEIFRAIGDFLGYNIRQWYKENGEASGSDWEIPLWAKKEYIELAEMYADRFHVRFYCADNIGKPHWVSAECCGTDFLRNYRIYGGCFRNKLFPTNPDKFAQHFAQCPVNFIRSKAFKDKTVGEVTDMKLERMKLYNS